MGDPKFEVRIKVIDSEPEKESEAVKAIAAQFLRMGINNVTVVADGEQTDYIDNEVHGNSAGNLFRTDPLSMTDVYIVGHGSPSIN